MVTFFWIECFDSENGNKIEEKNNPYGISNLNCLGHDWGVIKIFALFVMVLIDFNLRVNASIVVSSPAERNTVC